MTARSIYVIGSLRNEQIPIVAHSLRIDGHVAFTEWYSAGKFADDSWRDHEKFMGHTLPEALTGAAARHVFAFDKYHLDRADTAVLVLPAGKSCHLELGYCAGREKDCFILMEGDPDRWDVMLNFANKGVHMTLEDLRAALLR